MNSKPVYSIQYWPALGGDRQYKSWKTAKTAIKHIKAVKEEFKQIYGEECTITCEHIPAHLSWHTGPEFVFRPSWDECATTPGFQKTESFTMVDGQQCVKVYRNCRHGSDYYGIRIASKEEWGRVAPSARD